MSKSEAGLRLRYEQHEINPSSARVFLNDIDVSDGLIEMSIHVSRGMLTDVTLTIFPHKIDIDAQTMAVLTAVVETDAE